MEQRDSKRAREEALDVEKARGSPASENISRDLRAAAVDAQVALGSSAEFDRRFALAEPIGSGAFSVVRALTDRSTGARLCVKTVDTRPMRLRPNFSPRRLLREACILGRLKHPHIVGYVGCFEGPDAVRLVMERVAGRELFEVILEHRSLAERVAKPIIRQLTEALAYLHDQSIAHRDVKPENVLVEPPAGEDPMSGATSRAGRAKACFSLQLSFRSAVVREAPRSLPGMLREMIARPNEAHVEWGLTERAGPARLDGSRPPAAQVVDRDAHRLWAE